MVWRVIMIYPVSNWYRPGDKVMVELRESCDRPRPHSLQRPMKMPRRKAAARGPGDTYRSCLQIGQVTHTQVRRALPPIALMEVFFQFTVGCSGLGSLVARDIPNPTSLRHRG